MSQELFDMRRHEVKESKGARDWEHLRSCGTQRTLGGGRGVTFWEFGGLRGLGDEWPLGTRGAWGSGSFRGTKGAKET